MILEAKNVSYFYKSNKEKLILDHVSYQFEEGKLYAVLGPSGSGKTTLLSLLAGLDTPTEGEILYAGTPSYSKRFNRTPPSSYCPCLSKLQPD